MRSRNVPQKFALSVLAILWLSVSPATAETSGQGAARIVSIGGTITEILYALGAEDRIAAVDTTSIYPEAATEKPDIGYVRQISAEGVLSQKPDLILAEEGAGPPDALNILKASGVEIVMIPNPPQIDAIPAKIRAVGEAVGEMTKAEALAAETEAKLKKVTTQTSALPKRKKVLFALSLANGRVMAAGANTSAAAMIRLAGGENAVTGVEGYKPLSDEAVIAAAPDVVLVMSGGANHLTAEQAFALPALASSPAGKNNAFITMNGLYLLGLGPRAADAATDLYNSLYPEGQ
ncbi:ABC transporter substrate-binding protein [Peteryoungia desertarenae]|uniref:ABC transporter substrate-binding protein n=1 Tax=Peteryoungia desertarenae TaxID=1813451 RepID=A0ABX6QQK1_9HYPH|nr:ABC transporter substrate-binding protein [Peteryoungia desertarenae]QLF70769.1 ABC transporter substrate-binding protein [Peteryoungia desertarenae]